MPEKDDAWVLINSLGCNPIQEIEGYELSSVFDPKIFWQGLLNYEDI